MWMIIISGPFHGILTIRADIIAFLSKKEGPTATESDAIPP